MNLTAFEAFSIIFKGVKYLLKEEGGGGNGCIELCVRFHLLRFATR